MSSNNPHLSQSTTPPVSSKKAVGSPTQWEFERETSTYKAFFALPATLLQGYQNLATTIAGRTAEDAFPEGTWQFYVNYALREDTARHATETHGFDTLFSQRNIDLCQQDRMTAWAMAAISTLHSYDDLLKNEWRERVYTSIATDVADETMLAMGDLYRRWERRRPYRRGHDAKAHHSYARYRRDQFDRFLETEMERFTPEQQQEWVMRVRQATEKQLTAYQQQLSILAYLDPQLHGEERRPFSLLNAKIGIIYGGQYYLLPIHDSTTGTAQPVQTVRAQIGAILADAAQQNGRFANGRSPAHLMGMARVKRGRWPDFRSRLNADLRDGLDQLRLAPILLNFDKRPFHRPLSHIRQAERGIGDHAMTIFDTGSSFVFDLSHIFFDGTWGAALAEILSGDAAAWAAYLHTTPFLPIDAAPKQTITPLSLPIHRADWDVLETEPHIITEAFAETERAEFAPIHRLRRRFKQQENLRHFTINDILITYRAIHALTYKPSDRLLRVLKKLAAKEAADGVIHAAITAVNQSGGENPAILIPVDASRPLPRERVHPLALSIPVTDPDLHLLHEKTSQAATHDDPLFAEYRQQYMDALGDLGQQLNQLKANALQGNTHSIDAIELLGHLPIGLQRLLDRVPDRIALLNDIIKGREVFSNVGAVAASSSLTRFITAKDDNENKLLAWGVLTDAQQQMRLSLRDFRPHVAALVASGYQELANRITQDYLDSYAIGLNRFIRELLEIEGKSFTQ